MTLHTQSIAELSTGLRARRFSSVELTRHLLERIERLGPALNAFVTVTRERALADAAAADAAIARGEGGPLLGVPIVHKDIFCTDGILTTCGSRMLANFVAPYDATVVERWRTAGTVLLGKTNMDEFAMGSSNETSWFGPVRNPWDTTRVPGGSIRQPAALTNLTGVKPTYGRVSRYGMIAFASSLDQGGVLTRSAEDAALLLGAMAGFDPRDSTSVDAPVPDYVALLNAPLKGLRVGIVREFFDTGLAAPVGKLVRAAIDSLREQGATVREVSLPNLPLSVPTYYVVAPAECSSNLSRFDGVRFGHRCESPRDLLDLYKRSRGEGFGDEVKRRIMTGTYVLSAGYYDAYYLKAQQVRRLITADFERAFAEVDVVVGPTSPTAAFELGAKTSDPITMYLNDIYTIGANLAGLPAASIPCGFVDENGRQLPVGLQIIGPHFAEARLLNVAHQYQRLTSWHTRVPPGYE